MEPGREEGRLRWLAGGGFRIHDALRIPAPAALVYEVVADFLRYPEFIADVRAARTEGDTVTMVLRVGPMTIPLRTRVALSPPSAVEFTLVDGPLRRLVGRWELEGDGAETAVTLRVEGESGPVGQWMVRMAGRVAERHIEKVEAAFRRRMAVLAGAAAAGGGGEP